MYLSGPDLNHNHSFPTPNIADIAVSGRIPTLSLIHSMRAVMIGRAKRKILEFFLPANTVSLKNCKQ